MPPDRRARGVYERLGVTRVINAAGDLTVLGGALMPPEVRAAMDAAAQSSVRIDELQYRAGEAIARLTGSEAAYVTSGAAAALALGTAAGLARNDSTIMDRLPWTDGIANEIVMERAHRTPFERCFTITGAKLILVGTGTTCSAQEFAEALGPASVGAAWIANRGAHGLSLEEVVAVAHRRGKMVIVDAAAALPPAENLTAFVRAGADLVAFSGGKALRGPQASGFLCGRRDLIDSVARQHLGVDLVRWGSLLTTPAPESLARAGQRHGVGRAMKVGKEEIAGLIAALDLYVSRDHDAERQLWRRTVDAVCDALRDVPAADARPAFRLPNGRPIPWAQVGIRPNAIGVSASEICRRLREGQPPIYLADWLVDQNVVGVYPCHLQPADLTVLIDRLRAVLNAEGG